MMHGTMSLKCKFAVSSESHTWHTIAMQSACVLFIVKPGGTYNNRIIIHIIIGFKILNNVVQKIPPLVFQRDCYYLPECDAVWLECIYHYCGEFCCLYVFRPPTDGNRTFLRKVGNHFIRLLTCVCRDPAREPKMSRSSISVHGVL